MMHFRVEDDVRVPASRSRAMPTTGVTLYPHTGRKSCLLPLERVVPRGGPTRYGRSPKVQPKERGVNAQWQLGLLELILEQTFSGVDDPQRQALNLGDRTTPVGRAGVGQLAMSLAAAYGCHGLPISGAGAESRAEGVSPSAGYDLRGPFGAGWWCRSRPSTVAVAVVRLACRGSSGPR